MQLHKTAAQTNMSPPADGERLRAATAPQPSPPRAEDGDAWQPIAPRVEGHRRPVLPAARPAVPGPAATPHATGAETDAATCFVEALATAMTEGAAADRVAARAALRCLWAASWRRGAAVDGHDERVRWLDACLAGDVASARDALRAAADAGELAAAEHLVLGLAVLGAGWPQGDGGERPDAACWAACVRHARQAVSLASNLGPLLMRPYVLAAFGVPANASAVGPALRFAAGDARRTLAELFATPASAATSSLAVAHLLLALGDGLRADRYCVQSLAWLAARPDLCPDGALRAELHLGRAAALLAADARPAAEAQIAAAVALAPRSVALRMRAAQLLLDHGQRRQALAHLVAARGMDPRHGALARVCAAAYIDVHLLAQAAEAAATAIEVEPLDPEGHLLAAQVSLAQWEEDIGDRAANLRAAARHCRSAAALCDVQGGRQDVEWLSRAQLGLVTAQRQIMATAGVAAEAGLLDNIIATLRELHARAPDHVGHMLSLADCLTQAGRGTEAVTVLERAVEAAPADVSVRVALAAALIRQEKYADAVPVLNAAEVVEPESPLVLYLLGQTYAGLGDDLVAERHLRRAITFARGAAAALEANVYLALAELLVRAERLTAAAEMAALAVRLRSNTPDATLAQSLYARIVAAQKAQQNDIQAALERDTKAYTVRLDAEKERIRAIAARLRGEISLDNALRVQEVNKQTERLRSQMRIKTSVAEGSIREGFSLLEMTTSVLSNN